KSVRVAAEGAVVRLALSGTRCSGVEFLRDGQRHSARASREVVLCAGAVHTPRLLLLSGIGPQEELAPLGIDTAVDLPGVGRNLQDHVLVTGLCFEAKHPVPPPRHNLAGCAAFWKSRPDLGVPDLMFLPLQIPYVSDEIAARYPMPPNVFSIIPGLVRV